MIKYTELHNCLACNGTDLRTVLDLGDQPLANSYKERSDDYEDVFPLKLNFCNTCSHLQLSHSVNPDLLFKNYLYVSGTGKTAQEYFKWFATFVEGYFETKPTSVLDIACNDGSQLNEFKSNGLKTFGIDPATNLYPLSSINHSVVCDYLTKDLAKEFKEKHVDVLLAQNVFAHVTDQFDFLTSCKEMMHDNSVLFIQTSQANMIKNNEFDTIYHEHLSFYNAHSMLALAKRAGINLIDVIKTPIHGTSYIFVFSKTKEPEARVKQVLTEEHESGLQDPEKYAMYSRKCREIVEDFKQTIKEYRADGYVIAGYGAAAKGMTMLNVSDIQLDFIIDDTLAKQGLFTPGVGIPIVSNEILKEVTDLNVAFIPLAWNYFTEIREKLDSLRSNPDDVFIRYFPTIQIEK